MILAPLPNQENIRFDLTFESEFWNTAPLIDVYIDDTCVRSALKIDKQHHCWFEHVCTFQYHVMKIRRYGKTNKETRLNNLGHYDTQTLSINRVCIDNIDLRNIVWDLCEFRPEYPEPWASQQRQQGNSLEKICKGETILGHNGIWTFAFRSPIYQFIVDHVRGIRER